MWITLFYALHNGEKVRRQHGLESERSARVGRELDSCRVEQMTPRKRPPLPLRFFLKPAVYFFAIKQVADYGIMQRSKVDAYLMRTTGLRLHFKQGDGFARIAEVFFHTV